MANTMVDNIRKTLTFTYQDKAAIKKLEDNLKNFVEQSKDGELTPEEQEKLKDALVLLTPWRTVWLYCEILKQIQEANLGFYKHMLTAFEDLVKQGNYKKAFEGLAADLNSIKRSNPNNHKKIIKILGIAHEAYEQAFLKNQVWLLIMAANILAAAYFVCLYICNPKILNGGIEVITTFMKKSPFLMENIGYWVSKIPAVIPESVDAFGCHLGRHFGWKAISEGGLSDYLVKNAAGLITAYAGRYYTASFTVKFCNGVWNHLSHELGSARYARSFNSMINPKPKVG